MIALSTEYKREWSLLTNPERSPRITLYSLQVSEFWHIRRSVPGLHSPQNIRESDHSWHIWSTDEWSIQTYPQEWQKGFCSLQNIRESITPDIVGEEPQDHSLQCTSDQIWRGAKGSLSTVHEWSILTYPEECPKIALSTEYKRERSLLTYLEHEWVINPDISTGVTKRILLSTEYRREWSLLTYLVESIRITLYSVGVINPDISGGVTQGLHSLQNIRESDHFWHIRRGAPGSLSTVYEWSTLTYPEKSPRITLYSVRVINPDISGAALQNHSLQCTDEWSIHIFGVVSKDCTVYRI